MGTTDRPMAPRHARGCAAVPCGCAPPRGCPGAASASLRAALHAHGLPECPTNGRMRVLHKGKKTIDQARTQGRQRAQQKGPRWAGHRSVCCHAALALRGKASGPPSARCDRSVGLFVRRTRGPEAKPSSATHTQRGGGGGAPSFFTPFFHAA